MTLPNGSSGTYYVVVHTSGPYEFIYTGNNTTVSSPVSVSLTQPPDLTVTSIQTPSTVVSGGTIDVTWTVQNLGPGDADGLWPDVVSLQEVGGAGRTIPLGSFAYTATLAAGKSYTRTEMFTLPTDIQGVFQAVVTTDPDYTFGRDQYEVSNPVDTTTDPDPLTITLQSNPDLEVESITPAASHFQAGGTLGVQFVVINQGTVATTTPHWTDNVYLSLDDTLSEDDILLGSVGNQSALQPGQNYDSGLSAIPIPKDLAGPFFLIVEANANGAQDDFPNDNNNTLAVPITIDPLLPSDLVVSNVIVPTQAIAGSTIQVTYTVTNLGNGPTDLSSWTDGVWLATDRKEPYVTGTLLTTVTETGVLTNDPHDPDLPQSYTQTLTVTLPPHLSGQLFITPQTDIYEQLDETTLAANVNPDDPNELRSDNFKAAPIIVLPLPPPDLVVTAIKVPASAPAGTVYPVTWTVTNQGDGTTEDSQWYDGVYLSNEPTYNPLGNADPQQINLGYFVHNGILTPDQSYTEEQSILLSPSYSGDYIIVYTNELGPTGGFPGTWEGPYSNNDTAAVATDVFTAPADLQVTSVVTEPQALSGENTTVSWTVTNFGDPVWSGTQFWNDLVWVSPDPTFIMSRATYLGDFPHTNAQSLGTGQSYTNTQTVTLPPGIGGKVDPVTYYIYVQTDPLPPNPVDPFDVTYPESVQFYQSDVYEGEGANELNNTSSAPLPVYYREPDLFVNDLTLPSSAPYAGDTIPVTWTVINQGTRDTRVGNWEDGVYLSPFPSLDLNQSILLGDFQHSGILAMGASYTETQDVTLPYGISGTYYVLVFTDDYAITGGMGQVQEFQDEGNNITSAPLQVLPTPLPDLQVTSIDVPEQAIEGQSLGVTYTVTNTSTAPTLPRQNQWMDVIYLSVDQYLDLNSDIYLGTETHNGSLAGGASYTVSETFALPAGLTGSFYVFVDTDPILHPLAAPRGQVYEENEDNNSTSSTLPVIISQPPPADLVVTGINVPATAQTGQTADFAWTVTNQGQFPATGTWTDAVYLASTPIWNIDDPLIGEVAHTDTGLATGQSYTSTLDALLPPAAPGYYYVIVRTNIFGDVYEGAAGAANDTTASAGQTDVTVPALQLGVPVGTGLTEGDDQLYEVTVPANQTLQVSITSSDSSAANEIYLRYNAVPTTTEYDAIYNGPLEANQSALIPGTTAGTYFVLVSGTTNSISLLAQLLPFEISSVSPDAGGDSAYVTTIITGAQFDPNAIVKLVRPTFAEYAPVSYQVVNSTEIIAIFDLTDAPHGLYDVSVINPDGQEVDAPFSYLVEPALPPQVSLGLGGTRVMYSGDTGYYGVSLQSETNVDIPYVQLEFGIPNLGNNLAVGGAPYLAFSNNLGGSPNVAGVPWDDLSSTVDTTGYDLAEGYVTDLEDQGYVGLNFTAQTYPGVSKFTLSQILPAEAVGFTFNVVAAATPLTPAEYVAEQTQEAEYLRTSILADPTATQALQVLALNETSWDNLYLTALTQAGLLRPVDEPPAVHLDPDVNSMMATLAAGILAGSGGDTILTDGNLPAFFAQLQTWYGDDPTLLESGVIPGTEPMIAPIPSASTFNLNETSPTVSEAFNVYVRQISDPDDEVELYFPDLANPTPAQAADINQFLASAGVTGQGATLTGPTGYGPQQFVPVGQALPYTVEFQNSAAATSPVEQIRITTQLDPNLDPRTFRLGDLQIGDLSVQIPSGMGTFQGDFDYSQTAGFILRVSAGLDLDTNTATWLIQAIDPSTGQVLVERHTGLAGARHDRVCDIHHPAFAGAGHRHPDQCRCDGALRQCPAAGHRHDHRYDRRHGPDHHLDRHADHAGQLRLPGDLERAGRSEWIGSCERDGLRLGGRWRLPDLARPNDGDQRYLPGRVGPHVPVPGAGDRQCGECGAAARGGCYTFERVGSQPRCGADCAGDDTAGRAAGADPDADIHAGGEPAVHAGPAGDSVVTARDAAVGIHKRAPAVHGRGFCDGHPSELRRYRSTGDRGHARRLGDGERRAGPERAVRAFQPGGRGGRTAGHASLPDL